MKVLIVKTSSMGDVIHTLPALTDAAEVHPDIQFDWVVEEGFAEIPNWHENVHCVIPCAMRRWRKHFLKTVRSAEWKEFRQLLQAQEYDAVIDAQGLMKSMWIASMAYGPRYGLNWRSAKEPWVSLFYQHRCAVPWKQHAVTRVRQLFAQALDYTCPDTPAHYGVDPTRLQPSPFHDDYMVFIHGTSRDNKCWPESHWIELAKKLTAEGFKIKIPWGNEAERLRAERISIATDGAQVLPKMNLASIAALLHGAKAAVAMDTGLGHLAAALSVPTVSIYGPTNPDLIGAMGQNQVHLKGGLRAISAEQVYSALIR